VFAVLEAAGPNGLFITQLRASLVVIVLELSRGIQMSNST